MCSKKKKEERLVALGHRVRCVRVCAQLCVCACARTHVDLCMTTLSKLESVA